MSRGDEAGLAPEGELVELGPGLRGRVAGEGPGVLWIHGYTLDSSTWRELWPLLPGFRHVGVDLPGHGASAPIEPGTTLVELGERLAQLVEAEGIEHVVALSFGTIAALSLLLTGPTGHAARLRSAVLAAPGIAGGPTEPSMGPVYYRMSMLLAMVGRTPAITDLWLGSRAWRGVETRPGLLERVRTLVDRHPFEELKDRRKALMLTHPPQSNEALRTIATPVLVLVGDREMPAYQACAKTLEAQLPHARRVELVDTDHLCLLQAPEQAAPLILEHLRR